MATPKIVTVPDITIKRRIFRTLENLLQLPKVKVEEADMDLGVLWIKHPQEYVPNFKMEWDIFKKHYRVYIHVAHTDHHKVNAGYCICTVRNGLSAVGFAQMYAYLYHQRANQKGDAVAQ